MNKKIIAIVICTIFILSGCSVELGGNSSGTSIIDEYTFVDDMGNLIETGENYDKIISLSQTHTDNLFELGVGDRIIGVDKNTIYPEEVSSLPRYSLTNEYDVELIEKANPDLILITPSINKSYPAYVTKLETLGYKVVSLMPNNMSEFDIYIEKLAMLTKTTDIYREKLDDFYKSLDEISEMTSLYESKNVFIESSENGYKTPAEGTLPYLALEYVNANNIAGARHEEYANGLSASYGIEKIMENKDSIDVYLSIQGVDEPGASLVSINQKNEFNDIKAVKENNVFEIDAEIINSFSFRYVTGVYQLSRLIYPELVDDLSAYRNDDKLTREGFANIIVRYLHIPFYINNDWDYYEYERYGHTYGRYADISWQDEDFDYIETASIRNYLKDIENEDEGNVEYFNREALISKDDIALFIYIYLDIASKSENILIEDINESENKLIVQKVVDNGYLELDNGMFNPKKTYTNIEFIDLLDSLKLREVK